MVWGWVKLWQVLVKVGKKMGGQSKALLKAALEHESLKFHLDSFKNAEYLRFPQGWDLLGQTLPAVCFMGQPRFGTRTYCTRSLQSANMRQRELSDKQSKSRSSVSLW